MYEGVPRDSISKVKMVHALAVDIGFGLEDLVPEEIFKRMLIETAGIMSPSSIRNYVKTMQDLGFVSIVDGGIRFLVPADLESSSGIGIQAIEEEAKGYGPEQIDQEEEEIG